MNVYFPGSSARVSDTVHDIRTDVPTLDPFSNSVLIRLSSDYCIHTRPATQPSGRSSHIHGEHGFPVGRRVFARDKVTRCLGRLGGAEWTRRQSPLPTHLIGRWDERSRRHLVCEGQKCSEIIIRTMPLGVSLNQYTVRFRTIVCAQKCVIFRVDKTRYCVYFIDFNAIVSL